MAKKKPKMWRVTMRPPEDEPQEFEHEYEAMNGSIVKRTREYLRIMSVAAADEEAAEALAVHQANAIAAESGRAAWRVVEVERR